MMREYFFPKSWMAFTCGPFPSGNGLFLFSTENITRLDVGVEKEIVDQDVA